jgi:hypothetical protein
MCKDCAFKSDVRLSLIPLGQTEPLQASEKFHCPVSARLKADRGLVVKVSCRGSSIKLMHGEFATKCRAMVKE